MGKMFMDGFKDIWVKRREADIQKNLQENLIAVETQAFSGKISYISPQAEYTPPVIYSKERREKLLFLVEAHFDDQTKLNLNPGQPVSLRLE